MAKTDDARPDGSPAATRAGGEPERKSANGLTRRDFVKTGAAAGLGGHACRRYHPYTLIRACRRLPW